MWVSNFDAPPERDTRYRPTLDVVCWRPVVADSRTPRLWADDPTTDDVRTPQVPGVCSCNSRRAKWWSANFIQNLVCHSQVCLLQVCHFPHPMTIRDRTGVWAPSMRNIDGADSIQTRSPAALCHPVCESPFSRSPTVSLYVPPFRLSSAAELFRLPPPRSVTHCRTVSSP